MAHRYARLRGTLPQAFFAGRVLDLQAMTAAVFLLHTGQKPSTKQGMALPDDGYQSSNALVDQMLHTMDLVSDQPAGDFGKQAAKAIRGLKELLARPGQTDSQNVTIRIPLLGKMNINRHTRPSQTWNDSYPSGNTAQSSLAQPQGQLMTSGQSSQDYLLVPTGGDSEDFGYWSMDFGDDFPALGGNTLETDQWLSYGNFDVNGQI